MIAISNSGETMELEATVQTLIANGAHIISCTGNPQSTLAKQSEVCLVAHVDEEGDALNKPPRASILSEILILQCLSVVLQEAKKLDLNQYVKWHPGGSLGASIKERVYYAGMRRRVVMFDGIITPIVTPFHRDEQQSINYEVTKQLIDHLIAKGVKGIFILGSNGEFHVIEEAEKIEFAEKVIGMVDHRVPVYVGTGACSTKETIRLSKKMEELGADALSVITPYFLTPTEEELVQHFTAVAESVSIPIILYNIPKATGCNLSAEVVGRLAEEENIRGIKDSSGKEENLKAYAELAKRDDFDLLIGSDSKISYGYALGASGAVAGTSNVITEVLVELDRALRNGETEKAEELQKDIDVLRGVLKLGTVPVVMKRAAELAGIAEIGPARKPVQECSAQDDEKIKEMLQHYHLL